MIVRNKVREMSGGETLYVVATDPSTDRDFRDFCRFMGHELVRKEQTGERLEYVIRKGVSGGAPSRSPAEGSSPARGAPSCSPAEGSSPTRGAPSCSPAEGS